MVSYEPNFFLMHRKCSFLTSVQVCVSVQMYVHPYGKAQRFPLPLRLVYSVILFDLISGLFPEGRRKFHLEGGRVDLLRVWVVNFTPGSRGKNLVGIHYQTGPGGRSVLSGRPKKNQGEKVELLQSCESVFLDTSGRWFYFKRRVA